jgi:hypothetical protein
MDSLKRHFCEVVFKRKRVPWILLSVFAALTLLITGCIEQPVEYKYTIPEDLSTPPPTPEDLQSARVDYNWKLDLVSEQTTRLDMYYASKSGVSMTQREYKAWLDDLSLQTTEFIKRNLDAIKSGNAYVKQLNAEVQVRNIDYDWYSIEYDRVIKNHEIMESDIKKVYNNLYNRIDEYNSEFVR